MCRILYNSFFVSFVISTCMHNNTKLNMFMLTKYIKKTSTKKINKKINKTKDECIMKHAKKLMYHLIFFCQVCMNSLIVCSVLFFHSMINDDNRIRTAVCHFYRCITRDKRFCSTGIIKRKRKFTNEILRTSQNSISNNYFL